MAGRRPPRGPCSHPGLHGPAPGDEQFLSACAATIADWPDHEVIILVEQLLNDLRQALGDDAGRARPFLWSLVTARPSLGEALCERVLVRPAAPWHPLSRLSYPRWGRQATHASSAWRSGCSTPGTSDLARQVAHAFGIQRDRAGILDGEPALMRALVEHLDPDGIVPAATLGAVSYLAAQHRTSPSNFSLCTGQPEAHRPGRVRPGVGPHGALTWNDLAQRTKTAS